MICAECNKGNHCGWCRCCKGKKERGIMNKKIAAVAATALIGLGLLSGCSIAKVTEPFKDAPRSGVVNDRPADIIEMPDGFSNASTKCDHGNRIYVAYHGDSAYASIFVVAQDPTCRGQ